MYPIHLQASFCFSLVLPFHVRYQIAPHHFGLHLHFLHFLILSQRHYFSPYPLLRCFHLHSHFHHYYCFHYPHFFLHFLLILHFLFLLLFLLVFHLFFPPFFLPVFLFLFFFLSFYLLSLHFYLRF